MEIIFTPTTSCSLSYHFTIDLKNSSKSILFAFCQPSRCDRKSCFHVNGGGGRSITQIWKQQGQNMCESGFGKPRRVYDRRFSFSATQPKIVHAGEGRDRCVDAGEH